jgi:dienelactone hydrolase
MKNNRRNFIKYAGIAGIGIAGSTVSKAFAFSREESTGISNRLSESVLNVNGLSDENLSIIGPIGEWTTSVNQNKLPSLSFRRKEWTNLEKWKKTAKTRAKERTSIPEFGSLPKVTVSKKYEYDGPQVEELSWQLPYGRPTEAILLKPVNAKEPLPGILAFHDHGGKKYFGTRKITKTNDNQHPLMKEHQKEYYSGRAWANEIAKRGYVVLVSDAFPFASRRVMLQDVPENLREGLNDENPEDPKNIEAYNQWSRNHEDVMAKSLFCAGTTWPGVFFAEDRVALDVLCSRQDVDSSRIGCGGLSGGGMRTVYMGGLDSRIKCAVCVGLMSTWKDFLLHKSYTHTWMTFVPLLPNELDFPEIFGLRVPLPTMVLNDIEDGLFTLPEMKAADKILAEVFEKANASDRYKCSFYPGIHKFDSDMQTEAFDWFDKWLKKK